jgi:hypothetical protein
MNIHIIKRFTSGNLLVQLNYGTIRILTQQQYDYINKHSGIR